MFIWKISKLNKQLAREKLSESEVFKYLMANTVIYSIAVIPYGTPNQLDVYLGLISLVVGVLALWVIYRLNGGRNGNNFIERYFAVSWVVLIRTIVLVMLPLSICVIAYQEIYLGELPEETTLIDFTALLLFEFIYLVLIAKSIHYIAKNENA